jgi:hypothetical protein
MLFLVWTFRKFWNQMRMKGVKKLTKMCLKNQFCIRLRARITHFLKKDQNRGILMANVLDMYLLYSQ